ncbi:MAG: hypothetical protein H7332_16065 [Bdellovibrionales bacterium]|nr:hypothetical protein [Ramlibacter sp.]
MDLHQSPSDAYLELIGIGIALSAEPDPPRLRERILIEAKTFTNADAGNWIFPVRASLTTGWATARSRSSRCRSRTMAA